MKTFFSTIIFFTIFILAGCGSSLPKKNSVEPSTGVLAVPKSMRSELQFESGWTTDIQIKNANAEIVRNSVRLHPINGRQFAFVKSLEEGSYKITGFRRVPIGETAVGSPSDIIPLGRGIPFSIYDGQITVLPTIFHVSNESKAGYGGVSYQKFLPLEDEELEKFKAIMAKANKNNEWEVNWP